MSDSPLLLLTAPDDKNIPLLTELRQVATIVVGDSVQNFGWCLKWRFSPVLAAEDVWNGIEPFAIWGRQVWSFSPQDMFLFLAVHGGKHSWSALK